jgi:hypothetical protein
LWAQRAGRIPTAPPGVFSLGRWVTPLAAAGVAWAVLVIVVLTVPSVNHTTGYYTAGAFAIGVLWWLLVLRRRLNNGHAGPPELAAVARATT